jgi:deoxyribonuclease-4
MNLGAHMSIAGGLDKALLRGAQVGCTTIQIFTKNSNQWRTKDIKDEELTLFLERSKETKISPVIAHDGYLINLGTINEENKRKSVESLTEEIERADLLKIPYLVMHPGSHLKTGEQSGIQRIASNLNLVLEKTKKCQTMVLLETTAGQGTNLGYTFEQLAEIISLIKDNQRVGVCLDTCHIFAAGYDIRDKKSYEQTMKEFETILGLKKLKAIHLNDAKKDLGSKIDRHEHIGKGCIGLAGFKNLLNDPRLKDIPMILETPKSEDLKEDKENLKTLRSLIKN